MATTRLHPDEVLPTSELRKELPNITRVLAEEGAAAGLLVFGAYRKPQGAVMAYELVELLDPVIEDLVIAARIRKRMAEDDGTRYTLDEVAAKFGVDLEE